MFGGESIVLREFFVDSRLRRFTIGSFYIFLFTVMYTWLNLIKNCCIILSRRL